MNTFRLITFLVCLFTYANTTVAKSNNLVIINSTTNRNEPNNGDYWIATDLELALQELGYQTQTNYRGEYQNSKNQSPLLSIYMRG